MTDYVFSDIASNKSIRVRPSPGDEEHYIGLEHMSADSFEVDSYGSETELKGDKLAMSKGDLLFGRRRAYQRKVSIAPFDGIFSAHGMILEPNEKVVDKRFFPFFIRSDYFMDRAISLSVGSLSPTLNWSDIKKETFNLPDLQFQRDAAEVLWKLEELKKLLTHHLSVLDVLIKSRFIEMFGVREHYSSNWTMCGFDTCCNVIYGHPFDSSLFNETGEGTPLIRIRDINTGFSNTYTTEEVDSQYNVEDGDLLVGMDGDFNAIIWNHGPALLNQRVCKINAKQGVMNPVYLLYCLNPELQQIHSKTSSTTVKHLSAKEIKKIQFPIPSMELQNQFADFVKQVDKSKSNLLCYINMLNNGD